MKMYFVWGDDHCKIVMKNIQHVFAKFQTLERSCGEIFCTIIILYGWNIKCSFMMICSYVRFQVLRRDLLLNVLNFFLRTLGHDPHSRVSQQLEYVWRGVWGEYYRVDENFQPTLKLIGCLEELHDEQVDWSQNSHFCKKNASTANERCSPPMHSPRIFRLQPVPPGTRKNKIRNYSKTMVLSMPTH